MSSSSLELARIQTAVASGPNSPYNDFSTDFINSGVTLIPDSDTVAGSSMAASPPVEPETSMHQPQLGLAAGSPSSADSTESTRVHEPPHVDKADGPGSSASPDQSSGNLVTGETSTNAKHGDSEPDRYPILYKLVCVDVIQNSAQPKTDRFSTTPFEGLEPADNRRLLSVMDVCDTVWGYHPLGRPRRRNQQRDHFGNSKLEDDDEPFVAGRDFTVRGQAQVALRIMSKQIIEFLRNRLQYHSGDIGDEYVITAPYNDLAFTYEAMKQEVYGLEAEPLEPVPGSLRSHLKTVLDWFEPIYCKEIKPELDAHDKRQVTYDKLWLSFPDGTIVYTSDANNPSFYIVQSCSLNAGYWELHVWGLAIESKRIVRRTSASPVQISKFWGEKKIDSLPLIPLSHMSKADKDALIARGKKHVEYVNKAPHLLHYDGPLSGNALLRYSGAVVVVPSRQHGDDLPGMRVRPSQDQKGLRLGSKEPADGGGGPLYSPYNEAALSQINFHDEDMYLLLPGVIDGFALGKKQWALFDILSFVEYEKSNLCRHLVIPEKDLSLIKSLAKPDSTVSARGAGYNDFIDGKGLGKVILLHGPSGVGKTFTVECLAQDMGRPLLALTAGDIGTDQSLIEQKLSNWLDLAQRWNAIVLLDEADAYLAARAEKQLNSNAFVTGFLRVLEYHPGTIFLTTNQPGWIDDAFISRIHIFVQYDEMSDLTLKRVWEKLLTWAEREAEMPGGLKIRVCGTVQNYVAGDAEVQKMCRNGRDIRNAFQAAVKIAVARLPPAESDENSAPREIDLEPEDFRKAIENKKVYRVYRDSMGGQSERDRAIERGARRDESPLPQPGAPSA
jgi:hypothetical protein